MRIESRNHPLVKHLVKLRDSRAYRRSLGTVFVEGKKVIREIAKTHKLINLLVLEEEENAILVSNQVMQKLSGVKTPEGMVAEVEMPKNASLEKMKRILVFDQVSDPGNMGTLLRCALALGWEGAFILDGCCDPFNDKAMRAAKGATFRLPLCFGNWNELETLITREKMSAFVADIKGEAAEDVKAKEPLALILSNEAHGVSEEASRICKRITLPMSGEMESLNVAVAGGILLYLLKGCA